MAGPRAATRKSPKWGMNARPPARDTPSDPETIVRGVNMLHWNYRLSFAAAAALVVIGALGGFGWTWH